MSPSTGARTGTLLHEGWRVAPSPAGTIAHPTDLHAAPIAWRDAMVPGSVAGSLASGRCDDLGAVDAWDTDWWFHTTLTLTAAGDGHLLRFDGLATLATVWIDGVEVARHHTAMRSLDIALDGLSPGAHELTIVCRGLSAFEPPARPRQRWKTRLVPDARLRWLRTPLFGHMPGWTPPWPVIGPYRDVHVLAPDDDALLAAGVQWTTDDDGVISWTVDVAAGAGVASLRIGEVDTPLTAHDGRITGSGTADLPRWWPHTHGTPTLHEMSLLLDDRVVPVARVGARTISADRTDGAFALHVNGVAVFARGAVWTPLDAARAWNDPAALRIALEQVRDAGCNLLRLPGIGLPEQPEFHALCDELGVMVWFDLPYANFDHPFDDAAFGADARIEAAEQLRALARHASTAVVCGGSEVHQQAAMYGVAADRRHVPFLEDELPLLVAAAGLRVPVLPSTPWGGGLPFQVDTGVSHYYGVGAYRRPLDDARRADVRFTSECLAFAHVPAAETLDAWTGGELLAPHDPRWKARVPRDRGTGWDFEDVRDHYVRHLSGREPGELRAVDIERYLELGRAATAEAVDAATRDLRAGDRCAGALVFTSRDPWHGAGWGFIDVTGRPKSAWYVLARRFAARTCWFTDEGPSGLALHVVNDGDTALDATVHVHIVGRGGQTIDDAKATIGVAPHGRWRTSTPELFSTFHDVTWNYRFGPLEHVAVVATMVSTDGTVLATDVWTPVSSLAGAVPDPALSATVVHATPALVELDVHAASFAPWVHLEAPGWQPSDDWFHLPPGATRRVTLRPLATGGAPAPFARLRSLAEHRPLSVSLEPLVHVAPSTDDRPDPERPPTP